MVNESDSRNENMIVFDNLIEAGGGLSTDYSNNVKAPKAFHAANAAGKLCAVSSFEDIEAKAMASGVALKAVLTSD